MTLMRFVRFGVVPSLLLLLSACDQNQTPGGVTPDYRPRDGDPMLIRVAQEAMPIIRAVESLRAEYGRFPSDPGAIASRLPRNAPIKPVGNLIGVGEWLYSTDREGAGYTLSRKLGWDPSLIRMCTRRACHWIFDPGDGRPSVLVNLEPQRPRG